MGKNCLGSPEIKLPNKTLFNKEFRYIFLVQDRNYWHSCPFSYDKAQDLVLTFDFGVVNEIISKGGAVDYIDHLGDDVAMESYNYEVYDFFAKWHFDKDGRDIFSYKGIGFGNAFRIDIWNDITYYVRIWLSFLLVKKIKHEKMFIGVEDECTKNIITELNIISDSWRVDKKFSRTRYYFPIFRWMTERIHPSGIRHLFQSFMLYILDLVIRVGEYLRIIRRSEYDVFVHNYHPTRKIMEQLKKDGLVNVVAVGYWRGKDIFKEKHLPVHGFSLHHRKLTEIMVSKFEVNKNAHWEIEGVDVGEKISKIIIKRISGHIPHYLKTMDNIIRYFKNRKLRLAVTISNIGIVNCLILNYCRRNNIPTYLVINGWLGNPYLDDAKDATWINAYGESIRLNYFRGMNNVICLGDPRMDAYVGHGSDKEIDRTCPTIVIGAAGFNNIDLNSYLAFEFDFLNDVLKTCVKLQKIGKK